MNEFFIDLTNKCNLKCLYCNRFYGNDFICLTLFDKIIKKIFLNIKYIDYICLWGGEPFLHPNISEIFDIILKNGVNVKKKIKLVINTNGLLLSDKNILLLEKLIFGLPKNFSINCYISIDGITTFGNIERGLKKENIKKILRSIDKILCIKKENFILKINSVISYKYGNIQDLEKMINFFKKRNIQILFIFPNIFRTNYINITEKQINILLKKGIYILKKYPYVKLNIPVVKDVINSFYINIDGDIYHMLPDNFPVSKKYKVASNGDIGFIKTFNKSNISIYTIFNFLYVEKSYIELIKIFYKVLNEKSRYL